MTVELSGSQRKYLRGLAHGLKAVVQIGDAGVTTGVMQAVAAALLLPLGWRFLHAKP